MLQRQRMRAFLVSALVNSVLAISALAGCVPGGEPAPGAPAPPEPPYVPSALSGIFHRTGVVDPTNLVLRDGGRWVWSMNGCDTFDAGVGAWFEDPDGALLLPEMGQLELDWPQPGGRDVVAVWVRPAGNGGALSLTVAHEYGSEDVQTWIAGGVCPICGALGPVGEEPCEEPALPGET